MFQNSKTVPCLSNNILSSTKPRGSKASYWAFATWLIGIVVIASDASAMAEGAPQKVKPTLVVITPGFQAAGREMPHDWVDPLAEKVEGQLTKYGSQTQTLIIDWNTHLPNGAPADYVAGRVRDFLDQQSEDWDVLFIGHSRGGILNNKAIAQLGSPRNLGYLEEIMLDPTAAHFAGDQYPKTIPSRVNHAINYDDNHRLAGDISDGGHPIENADNRNIGLGHHTDVGAHTSIEKFWTDNRAEQDIGEFLAKKDNRQDETLQPSPAPSAKSRQTVRAPVASNDRWLDESERTVGGIIRGGRKAMDDARQQAARAGADISREGGEFREHVSDAIADPLRAARSGGKRISAGASHARDMAGSGLESAGRAVSSGWKSSGIIVSSGAKSAGHAVSTRVKNAGGVISSGAKSAGGYVSTGAKSAGGVISSGAKNAGGVISSGAKSSGGYISTGAKSAGGIVSSGAKNTGGYISSGAKSAGGYASSGAKSAGGVVSSGAKNAGGYISSGAKSAGGAISSSAKNAGGAISRGFKSLTGR